MTRAKRKHLHQKRRKLIRLGSYLISLLSSDLPSDNAKFYHEWNIRETSWVELIQYRSRMLRSQNLSKREYAVQAIEAVLDNIEWFLATFPDINKKVGVKTCAMLRSEVTKIYAHNNDKRLYRLVSRYRVI